LGPARGEAGAGVPLRLFDGAESGDAFVELGMLPQEFQFEHAAIRE
jgi:hypothetical protein